MNIIEKPFNQKCSLRGGQKIKGICLHIAQSANGGIQAIHNWANSPNNPGSWHYAISKKGEIFHYCPNQFAAWTQGLAWRNGVPYNPYGKKLDIARLAKIVRDNKNINPNAYLIGVEHEGNTGEPWTEAMYKADTELIKYCAKQYGFAINRDTVIGHYQVDYIDRASCPGTGLNWNTLFQYLNSSQPKPMNRIKLKADGEYYIVNKGGWRSQVIQEIISYGYWKGDWKQWQPLFDRLNPVTPKGGWKSNMEVKVKEIVIGPPPVPQPEESCDQKILKAVAQAKAELEVIHKLAVSKLVDQHSQEMESKIVKIQELNNKITEYVRSETDYKNRITELELENAELRRNRIVINEGLWNKIIKIISDLLKKIKLEKLVTYIKKSDISVSDET